MIMIVVCKKKEVFYITYLVYKVPSSTKPFTRKENKPIVKNQQKGRQRVQKRRKRKNVTHTSL